MVGGGSHMVDYFEKVDKLGGGGPAKWVSFVVIFINFVYQSLAEDHF